MELVRTHSSVNRPLAPLCSICIAHFRGHELIAECIESVLAQNCDFSFEIIVHDDASPDDSVAFMLSQYPQIEVLESKENVGFCVANNRMVEYARGKYVLLLNNDAALFPDALSTLADSAENSEETGILTLPQYDWESGELVDRGCLLDPFYNPVPNLDPERTEVAMVIGACLWIRRETWQDLGGFPEWFESIAEDLYLCCLLRLGGKKVGVTNLSGYRHKQGTSFGGNRATEKGLSTTYRRRYLSERNKTYVLILAQPKVLLLPALTLHIAFLLAEGLILSAFARNLNPIRKIYWPALASVFYERKSLAHRRLRIQQARTCRWRNYGEVFTVVPRKLQLIAGHGIPKIEY
ncbi:glycosyltransferase family 2 protein [Haliea sp.]|uniref:glycosyltransferase family 2 protein n=1 Tax=Haliea sp. TaxID=1932666 RepID=UPI0035296C3B